MSKKNADLKSLLTEGTAVNRVVKSAVPCGQVMALGPGGRKRETREAARLCCNTPAANNNRPCRYSCRLFFFLGQSLWGTVSSDGSRAGPTPPETTPVTALALLSTWKHVCALQFLSFAALQNSKDNMGPSYKHPGVG